MWMMAASDTPTSSYYSMSSAYVTPKLTSSARDARPGSWWRTITFARSAAEAEAQPVPHTMMNIACTAAVVPNTQERRKSYDAARTRRGWDAGEAMNGRQWQRSSLI